MVQLTEVHPRTIRLTVGSPRAQNLDAKRLCTRDDAVPLRHVEPARVPLRLAVPSHQSLLTRCIGVQKNIRTDHPISYYLDAFTKTVFESIKKAVICRRRTLFAVFVARKEDKRLPKYVMFGELVGGAWSVGREEKEWMECFLDGLRAFAINADQ